MSSKLKVCIMKKADNETHTYSDGNLKLTKWLIFCEIGYLMSDTKVLSSLCADVVPNF